MSRLLLQIRRDELSWREVFVISPGIIRFASGGIDEGKTHVQATVRKFAEELGIILWEKIWKNSH
jgi:hypothetical protein